MRGRYTLRSIEDGTGAKDWRMHFQFVLRSEGDCEGGDENEVWQDAKIAYVKKTKDKTVYSNSFREFSLEALGVEIPSDVQITHLLSFWEGIRELEQNSVSDLFIGDLCRAELRAVSSSADSLRTFAKILDKCPQKILDWIHKQLGDKNIDFSAEPLQELSCNSANPSK